MYDIVIEGIYELIVKDDLNVFVYFRYGSNEKLFVINNFYGIEVVFILLDFLVFDEWKVEVLLMNDDVRKGLQNMMFCLYEFIVYCLMKLC